MLRKHFYIAGILVLASVFFSACQANPEKDIVTSKNDGAFEENIQNSAQAEQIQDIHLSHQGTFQSMDGSVEFTWKLDQAVSYGAMPVLEVAPRFFTGEDAKHVAQALFGENMIFYDLGPVTKRQLSKSEILERIQILSQYVTEDALTALMGEEANLSNVKFWLEHYTVAYETAPEENPHEVCDWKLKDSKFYKDDASASPMGNKWLKATATINGHEYLLRTLVRNQSDYQENALYVTLGDGNDPTNVLGRVDFAQMCLTNEPTQEQIEDARDKTQEMLSKMGLGEFTVAKTFVEKQYLGDILVYQIRVDAVPVFAGQPILYGDLGRSYVAEEAYNSDYPVGQAQFFFGIDG